MSTEIWSFKYEPKALDEMILHPEVKSKLEKALIEIPNLMLVGSAGVGKGTFTKILLEQTGLQHLWVNASNKTGIDYIRDTVENFAFVASKELKIVVFNEASALSRGDSGAQKALKDLIESTQEVCRFFFLLNEENLMISELLSRCMYVKFDRPPIKDIALMCSKILRAEDVKYENKTLIEIIKKCYPDIRRTIWALQENSINGELIGSSIYTDEEVFKEILQLMKDKDLNNLRTTLRSNSISYHQLYNFLYDNAGEFGSAGGAILSLGKHMRWDLQAANREINFMHMVVEMIWEKAI
jgi:DNA polymerase III delta prime subunit